MYNFYQQKMKLCNNSFLLCVHKFNSPFFPHFQMYGRIVSGFESVWHAIVTLTVMIRGTFDFWPMLDYHPIFSHFYVYSYYAFAYGLLVAFVIAILQSTFKVIKSQMYYKATLEMQDYEMIDFMLKRFKLWTGIQKQKPVSLSSHFKAVFVSPA